VRARIEDFAAKHHLDEVILLTITHDPDARRRSYELVAAEFGLAEARQESGSASSARE
jgi:hypothetical protein